MSELATGLAETTNATPVATDTPPPSTPTVPAERPQTWADAFKHAEGAAATPSPVATPTPEAQTPVPAREEPPQTQDATAGEKGPIPFDRHEAAVKNARDTGRQDAEKAFQQQYGGALEVATALQRDPVGTVMQLATELQAHPEYGQQLRSAAGKMLAAQRGQPKPVSEPEPEADLQLQDGTLVYSAPQLAKREAWRERQLQERFKTEFEPLVQFQQQIQVAQRNATLQAQAEKDATSRYETWIKQPHFKEHQTEIAKVQAQLFEQGHDTWTALGLAYAQVMQDVVLPKLHEQRQQEVVASAVAKAAGRTDNPATRTPAPPGRPKSWREALEQAGLRPDAA